MTLPCPDHTTLSRRNATVEIRQQVERASQGSISLIVDSSGLKLCGQGEWHVQKHGEKQQKRWKKLHIGVDAQGRIVASTVTESHAQDPSQVPRLLSQVEGVLNRFIGDGMYDKAPVYATVAQHSPGARVIIPPRKDAVVSPTGTTVPTQRDQHLLAIERAGRFERSAERGVQGSTSPVARFMQQCLCLISTCCWPWRGVTSCVMTQLILTHIAPAAHTAQRQ